MSKMHVNMKIEVIRPFLIRLSKNKFYRKYIEDFYIKGVANWLEMSYNTFSA